MLLSYVSKLLILKFSYRRCGKKRNIYVLFSFFLSRCCAWLNCFLTPTIVNTADQNPPHATIDFRSRHTLVKSIHGQPASCRARPVNVDGGLEDVMWTRGIGSETLPAASYDPHQTLNIRLFFAIGERSIICVFCFLHTSRLMFFSSDAWPGHRPPHITGRRVDTVTPGWVGAPNERAPFRFHNAIVGFVDRCLSRTCNLAAWT